MSGPKLSAAELERMRREQLEKERLDVLRQLQDAQKNYRDACSQAADTKRKTFLYLDKIASGYANAVRRELDAIYSKIQVQDIEDDKNLDAYQRATGALKSDMAAAMQQADACINRMLKQIQVDTNLSSADFLHQSFQAYITMQSDPVDVKNIDFQNQYDQNQLLQKLQQVLQHYQWLRIHGDSDRQRQFALLCANQIQKQILPAVSSMQKQDVIHQIQKMINEETDIQRREREWQAAYDRYVAIATILDIIPKPPSAYASLDITAVQQDADALYAKYQKKDEMDYIANQINEAMVSLGYGLVTSKVLTRTDQSEMDLSLYQADDETGIAIYTDQTGAVMMRMTVLGEDDIITDEDRDFSLQRQIDFCAGHADIVEALAARGVYLKQTSYQEPDKKHTYKVNMNKTGVVVQKDANGQSVLRRDTIDRRKRRRANKKKMRAM